MAPVRMGTAAPPEVVVVGAPPAGTVEVGAGTPLVKGTPPVEDAPLNAGAPDDAAGLAVAVALPGLSTLGLQG